MRMVLIIICIILLLYYLALNIKVKESTLLKLCNTLMQDKTISQKTIDEYANMVDSFMDMDNTIILDVTDNFALLRSISREAKMSTPETFKENINKIIKEYS